MADARLAHHWPTVAGALVAAGTLIVMVATEPSLAIVWDEGYTLGREARVRTWFRALRDPARFAESWEPPRMELVQRSMLDPLPPTRDALDTRAKLFQPDVLSWFWPFAREEPHGHPPFYALVGLIGDVATPWRQDLVRARFGPILAFSLTAGALFGFVSRRWGAWPAALAASAWVFQPRLFAHAHYATYDALLTSLWAGSILAFAKAVDFENAKARKPRWRWVLLFGLLAGWAADTKFTGWFLPIPFLAWTIARGKRRGAWTLAVAAPLAIATLYVFNPGWWGDPVGGVLRFLESNLTRGKTQPIPVLFLGQVVMTPRESLPWYNTLVWTVFVTPVGFLLFAIAGVVRSIVRFRREPFGLLALGSWAFFLVLRALPHTPGHDGVRQFLPAFGCLALVAGLGAAWALERFGRWGKLAIAAAIVEGIVSVGLMMPVPLSYYSPVVGGLPGATALGMEPTYYWDSLTDDALDWLNAHTATGKKVRFATNPTSWLYLERIGQLRPALPPVRPETVAWYVVQNRPGALSERDRALIRREGPGHVLVAKWGVPLIWAFPMDRGGRP